MSRTPFNVGQVVVVCDHKHVMLADFYDGICPTCHSSITVPFERNSVEYPKPPKPKPEFLSWFFPANVTRKLLPKIITALGWMLGIMVVSLAILIATGTLSNNLFLYRIENLLIPKTQVILSRIDSFWFTETIAEKFASSGLLILSRNEIIFAKTLAVLSVMGTSLWSILISLWSYLHLPLDKSRWLIERFCERTRNLVEMIVEWVNGVIKYFV